jgi:hypothetical protein
MPGAAMPLDHVRPLYESANGDVWSMGTNEAGKVVVLHEPNRASGGKPSEMDISTFLNVDHYGPEHEALLSLLLGKKK